MVQPVHPQRGILGHLHAIEEGKLLAASFKEGVEIPIHQLRDDPELARYGTRTHEEHYAGMRICTDRYVQVSLGRVARARA